jgi:hypothetical protein
MRLNQRLDTGVCQDFDAVHALFFRSAARTNFCDAWQLLADLCHAIARGAVFL